MAVRIVKKSRGLSGGAFSGTGSRSREQSPLRPKNVEKMPPCRRTCPSGNRVREFVMAIAQAERLRQTPEQAWQRAWELYVETSPFPAVCGRVCPAPCQTQCNRKGLEGAVGINQIERALGDFGIEKGLKLRRSADQARAQKIAVIGAGPRGLSCAYHLARRGYGVTVLEAEQTPGGMLRRGLCADRLAGAVIDAEIGRILDLGVQLKCGVRVGRDVGLEELGRSYDAVDGARPVPTEAAASETAAGAVQSAASLVRVTAAIGQGRRTAEAIDRKFLGTPAEAADMPVIRAERMRLDHYERAERARPACPDAQLAPGLSPEQVIAESRRCMSCGYCFDCEKCWLFCQDQAVIKPAQKGALYSFKLENCTGCKKCAEECPCGFIDMV